MSCLVVHGGAGAWPGAKRDEAVAGCHTAYRAGFAVLRGGGCALDAVETAVRVMESDPLFNAGRGAHVTRAGIAELDAIVVDGAACDFGAVAGLVETEHPVSVARRVLEASPHCFLAGPGVLAFARQQEFPRIANDRLASQADIQGFPPPGDTVGAVALDSAGRLAAATSTGGTRGKWEGRVGDSPVIGCGAYADMNTAVSTTGHGEAIMRVVLARRVAEAVEQKRHPEQAAEAALAHMQAVAGGKGGVISVTAQGQVGVAFTTAHMPWVATAPDGSERSGF